MCAWFASMYPRVALRAQAQTYRRCRLRRVFTTQGGERGEYQVQQPKGHVQIQRFSSASADINQVRSVDLCFTSWCLKGGQGMFGCCFARVWLWCQIQQMSWFLFSFCELRRRGRKEGYWSIKTWLISVFFFVVRSSKNAGKGLISEVGNLQQIDDFFLIPSCMVKYWHTTY